MPKMKAVAVAVATLYGLDVLAANLSPEQVEHIEAFAGLVLEHDMSRDAFTEQADAIVRATWAQPAPYEAWKPTIRAMRELSQYAAKCLRDAYKRVHTDLPTAGDPRATGGTKGQSAKKWANGFASDLGKLTERLATMPKRDLNGARMKRMAKLLSDLDELISKERAELAA